MMGADPEFHLFLETRGTVYDLRLVSDKDRFDN